MIFLVQNNKMPHYSTELKLNVLQRLDEGNTVNEVVNEFSVLVQTVRLWIKNREKIENNAREEEVRKEVIKRIRENGEKASDVAQSMGVAYRVVKDMASKRARQRTQAKIGLELEGQGEKENLEEFTIELEDRPYGEDEDDVAVMIPLNRYKF